MTHMDNFHAKEQIPGLLDWMRAQMRSCGDRRFSNLSVKTQLIKVHIAYCF